MAPEKAPAAIQNVVEMRNVRAISLAAQNVEAQLAAILESGRADTESKRLLIQGVLQIVRDIGLGKVSVELGRSIDELLETVHDLDQSALDLLAGAEAQIVEIIAELEESEVTRKKIPLAKTLALVDDELKRREEARKIVSAQQVKLEDERDIMLDQAESLRALLTSGAGSPEMRDQKETLERKLAGLIATIDTVAKEVAENDRKVDALLAYQNAAQLIEAGIPSSILGETLFDFSKF